eukprot:TRINITY_DN9640_c0_g1_i2.p6 TRINITY_DN9640_c0_g1~~TRINITY_DN9640_c0_g1_i2.p6  ORF type:complete len:100 (-),score=3.12 TRINITY_DN9640_c0_g1_i2:407-706(-)
MSVEHVEMGKCSAQGKLLEAMVKVPEHTRRKLGSATSLQSYLEPRFDEPLVKPRTTETQNMLVALAVKCLLNKVHFFVLKEELSIVLVKASWGQESTRL